LCVMLVLIAEVLVFIPSAANFRRAWLEERIERAQTASLAVEASPSFEISDDLSRELLANAEVLGVALKRDGQRQLILAGEYEGEMPVSIDLRETSLLHHVGATLALPFHPRGRILRLLAEPRLAGGEFIEVVVREAPLRDAMIAYSLRVLALSLIIALFVAAGMYLVLNRFLVWPLRRLVADMVAFRNDPSSIGERSAMRRADEFGLAEAEFSQMREQVREALREKARLATLGEAVAKINHDLRNVLTAAHLISDRLRLHVDPQVSGRAERLVRSIDRGVRLAEDVLRYGRAEEGRAQPASIALRPLIEDAFQDASAAIEVPTGLDLDVDPELLILADPDHVHRIALNLIRNAVQAMAKNSETRGRPGVVHISAYAEGQHVVVAIRDEASGIPDHLRERLFIPFESRSREGGSGLGLAIARQLAEANEGSLALKTTGSDGTVFEVRLPTST
jgi:signal transduction histidine kinase